jgi:hypothetical protein
VARGDVTRSGESDEGRGDRVQGGGDRCGRTKAVAKRSASGWIRQPVATMKPAEPSVWPPFGRLGTARA